MRKFKLIRPISPASLSLQGRLPEEIAAQDAQPVTLSEFRNEGAATRDSIARAYDEIARLGARVYELERQMQEWKEHLV